jgi:hypothetical protein
MHERGERARKRREKLCALLEGGSGSGSHFCKCAPDVAMMKW